MDGKVFALIFFVIVVAVPVVFGVGGDMFKRWLKHKEAMTKALNEQTAEKAAQYAAHVERLEQRVRVLERITTDPGVKITDEIERLRDERPN